MGPYEKSCTMAPPIPAERADYAAFMERHTDGVIPADRTLTVMDTVVSGPEALLEVKEGTLRRAVALLIDICQSEGNAAELTIVCPEKREDWLDAILDWALAHLRKQGLRERIDVPQWIPNLVPENWLERNGFRVGYTTYQMETDSFSPRTKEKIPPGWKWADCRAEDADAFHETLHQAFRTVPGAFVPEKEAFRERCLRYPIPAQLLWDANRVAAFVRVEKRADGSGELHILGRHPSYSGRGLGEILVERGLRQLGSLGARRIHLEVVATNRAALALYERFGFKIKHEMKIYRRLIEG